MIRHVLGLDLGQAHDPTALAVVEHVAPPAPPAPVRHEIFDDWVAEPPPTPAAPSVFHLRHLARLPLGTSYPDVVAHVGKLLERAPLKGSTELVCDATGVGRPVVDLLRQAKLWPVAVTITGGVSAGIGEDGFHRVPKRDLVVSLQVLFQQGRLKVAEGLKEWPVLEKELLAFKVKLSEATGHDSYNAREGEHDDLVLALALACWRAKRLVVVPHQPLPSMPRRW